MFHFFIRASFFYSTSSFFNVTNSELCSPNLPSYIQRVESPFFPHCISLVRNRFHLESFSPRTVSMWNRLPCECFPITTVLTSPSLGSIFICSSCHRNLQFRISSITFISHTVIVYFEWLLGPCVASTFSKKKV